MSTGKPSWWGNIGDLLKKNSAAAAWVAVISVLVTSYLDIRKDNRVGFQDVAKEYQQENLRLREVERRCLELEVQLSRQLSQLQNKLVLLESASQDLPFPHWLKSGGTKNNPGIMLALNRSYEAAYLLPIGKTADDYIGKTDAQFWGEEVGSRYWENDMQVITSGAPIDEYEVDPTGYYDSIRVVKYPRKLGSRVIGIGGMVLPYSYDESNRYRKKKQ